MENARTAGIGVIAPRQNAAKFVTELAVMLAPAFLYAFLIMYHADDPFGLSPWHIPTYFANTK